MKHTHTEGPGSILKSRLARGVFPLMAALLAFALAAPEARAAVPADFAKTFTVTVPAGLVDAGQTLTSFPLLLRLGTGILGFNYADFRQNGADILVQDASGNALPYELENWDTAGESRLWVRVPSVAEGTTLTVYYGSTETITPPAGMWSGYAGVWHFNEAGDGATTIADSTANGQNGTSHVSSKARSDGKLGAARGLELDGKNGAMTTVPSSAVLDTLVPTFTVSGWVRPKTLSLNWGYLFARKTSDADPSWGLQFRAGDNANSIGIYSNGNADNDSNRAIFTTSGKFTANTWTKYAVVYDDTTIRLYLDGALVASKSAVPGAAVNKSNGFGIGGFPTSTNHSSLKADQDEVRLMNGAASAAWVAAEYRQENGDVALSYGTAHSTDASAPTIEAPVLSRNPATDVFTVAAEISGNVPASVVCDADGVTNTMATTDSALPMTYTATLAGLAADTTYACLVSATSTGGTVTEMACPTPFYNGDLSVAKVNDANEYGLVPGAFRISRADTAHDLTITYTIDGTATPGQTYETLSGTATIPAGSSSVDVEVVPLIDAQTTEDKTVVLTLNGGLYGVNAQAGSAELTVVNLVAPAGYNTWVATSDGLASEGSNWSKGVAPAASDNILFDGRFSTANCTWDSAASATVASWTQNADYTGTVEIQTTYASGAFPLFSIVGDCIVSGGKWTHPANNDSEAYRLKVSVGEDFTLAAAATIDVTGKGYAKNKFPSGSGKGVHGGGCGGCGATYGDPFVPERLGSGYNSPGGGAVYLAVAGAATVDGTITTQASQGSTTASEYGAPGSIYLQAASIGGNGYVYANNPGGKRCAGGRIALHATGSEEIGIPVSHMSVQGGFSSVRGGSGTILLRTKNQEHGVLYIDTPTRTNYYTNGYPTSDETTVIPNGQTWTVDGIDFQNSGILTVGPGTTLALANGFASITGGARTAGILYNGGTITSAQASSETLSGTWTFQANRNYAFTGDVTVKNGASIGGLRLYQVTNYVDRVDYLCDVRVAGNLTVESGGFLSGDFSGYTYKTFAGNGSYQNSERFGDPYAHGGQIFLSENGAYGSILNPAMPGTYGQTDDKNTQNLGGGALKLVVDGALTIDGTVTSVGGTSSSSGQGSGGSINITAGSLSGSGTMSASGCKATSATTAFVNMDYMLKNRGVKSASAGGRIAVRLTGSGASFSNHWIENILATGALNTSGGTVFSNGCASAGTVYLQTVADGEGGGTVYVRNGDQTTNPAVTPIPSTRWGGERDDLTKASLAIGAAARVKLFDGLKMKSLEMTSGTTLDLNGKALTVKSAKLGGTKLSIGTYAAGDEAVAGYVTDSGEGGELVVTGGGFYLFVR